MHYDPETAPIGDMELGIFVFVLSLLSNQINQKFGSEFAEIYARSDLAGRVARKMLYMPVEKSTGHHPQLSLRRLASYQFIVYFIIFFSVLKLISGFSLQSTFLLVSFSFLVFSLLTTGSSNTPS